MKARLRGKETNVYCPMRTRHGSTIRPIVNTGETEFIELTNANATLRKQVTELTAERDAAIREAGEWASKCGRVEAERDRMKAALDEASHLIAFIAGEKDLNECGDCQVSECCACCSIMASRLEKKIAQAAIAGKEEQP